MGIRCVVKILQLMADKDSLTSGTAKEWWMGLDTVLRDWMFRGPGST